MVGDKSNEEPTYAVMLRPFHSFQHDFVTFTKGTDAPVAMFSGTSPLRGTQLLAHLTTRRGISPDNLVADDLFYARAICS
jgi:hypothetical protein